METNDMRVTKRNGELEEIRKPKSIHKTRCSIIRIVEKVCRLNSERNFQINLTELARLLG